MLYASLYFIFMGVWYSQGGLNEHGQPYVYSALDFSTEPLRSALLIVAVVFLAIPAVHTLIWIVTKIRQFIYEKCCCGGTSVTTISPEPPQMVRRMSIGIADDKRAPVEEEPVSDNAPADEQPVADAYVV